MVPRERTDTDSSERTFYRRLLDLGAQSEIEPLLERIGGNHTPYVTTADDGRLVGHPLPIDPGVIQRRDAIVQAELPIRLDPKLVQLRADSEQSKTQIANKRLTGAQDLVWALINTPAFLFNR